jgi:hypothetical protein
VGERSAWAVPSPPSSEGLAEATAAHGASTGSQSEATEAVVAQVVFPSQLLSGYERAVLPLAPGYRSCSARWDGLRQEHVEGVDATFGRMRVTVVGIFVAGRAARAA